MLRRRTIPPSCGGTSAGTGRYLPPTSIAASISAASSHCPHLGVHLVPCTCTMPTPGLPPPRRRSGTPTGIAAPGPPRQAATVLALPATSGSPAWTQRRRRSWATVDARKVGRRAEEATARLRAATPHVRAH